MTELISSKNGNRIYYIMILTYIASKSPPQGRDSSHTGGRKLRMHHPGNGVDSYGHYLRLTKMPEEVKV